MTLQGVFNIISSFSIANKNPISNMSNTFSTPQPDEMEYEKFELIPSEAWNITYLSVPGVLPLATRINSQRVCEVFTASTTSIPALATSTQPPQTNTYPHHIRVSAPSITPYDGMPQTLRPFCSQLLNQLQDHDHAFSTESSKVRFAYQCLGPGALSKMRSSFRCLEDPTIKPEIENLSDFITALKRQCQDPGLRDKATRVIETMTQGTTTFHEFITNFEDNMADSIYAELGKDTWKIMLERRLSYKLRDILLSSSDAPVEYHEFVAYLRKKDAIYQEMRATFRAANPVRQPALTHLVNNANHNFPSSRSAPRPHELTVSQGGSAMDLDSISRQRDPDGRLSKSAKNARRALGRCLRCNEPGHIALSCPLRTTEKPVASVATISETTTQLKD